MHVIEEISLINKARLKYVIALRSHYDLRISGTQ